jgi:ribosomal protein L35
MAGFKLKNHSGASKRFKRSGTGKWIRRKASNFFLEIKGEGSCQE